MTNDSMVAPDDLNLVPHDERSRSRYRSNGTWSGRTLPADLVAAAQLHKETTALVTDEGSWTYQALFSDACRFAHGLVVKVGVRPGEPVMFQMGNVAETVVAYLGCLLAAARPVCTLPMHGVREIGLLAEHIGSTRLIAQADFGKGQVPGNATALLTASPIETVVMARGGADVPGAVPFEDVVAAGSANARLPYLDLDPLQVAVFQLSGGTTGLPKVAARLHEEYAFNSRAWAEVMGYGSETVLLYPLPVMHNAGISLALQPAILSGSTLVLTSSADIDGLLDHVEAHRPDTLPLMPPALAIRLLESERAQSADLSCIRDFVVGGQVLPVEVSERLRDDLGIAVRQMFGMAEGMFFVTPGEASEQIRHHTVGAPISAHDEVRVLVPGGEDEVPDGAVGELAARGPYTIRGYYRADDHNRTNFTPDGFYRTGDLARRHVTDTGTYYSIEGRLKDVINRGVEKIHAEEVEDLIVRHPDVATAALVAMPDPVLGERACAYLVMEAGAEALAVQSLGEHLLARGLAKYKLPERVEIVSALPLTNVGKVAKKELRADIEKKLVEEKENSR